MRLTKSIQKFVVSLLLLHLTVPAFGQNFRSFRSTLELIEQRTRWRIGPIRIFPVLQFREVGYDDNIYQQGKNENPVSDYTATFSPQVNFDVVYRNRIILSFMENPEYVFYVHESQERAFNNSYSPRLNILVFNRFNLEGSYMHRKSRRRASSEFDERANEQVQSYTGRVFFETARETSFGFSGSVTRILYEDILRPGLEINLSRFLNREEKKGLFEFNYRIWAESFLFIQGGYTQYRFEHPDSRDRNSNSYHAQFGIRFPLLARLRGVFALGYKRLWPIGSGQKGFSGLTGNTNLILRTGRFGFRFQYTRDSQFSYSSRNIFFVEDWYGAGISWYLTYFLRIDYDFYYGRAAYPELVIFPTQSGDFREIKREDRYSSHKAGLVFRIIRNTGIGVMINYWQRSSTFDIKDSQKWFIGGYLTHEF